MARKSQPSTRSNSVLPSLLPAEAIHLLQIRCDKAKAMLANRPITSSEKTAWETGTRDVLIRAFGSESPNVSSVMDVGRYAFAFAGGDERAWEQQRAEDMETRLKILFDLIELLHSEESFKKTGKATLSQDVRATVANRVFLVHGHDERAIHETARWLERFDLQVTILREEPNAGRTTIEKFIDFSDVAFAIILLTGDDRGGVRNVPYEEQKLRARQNVILELGFFLGKLGRKRVCALYETSVELPLDYLGVLYVPLDDHGAWRLSLARELKAADLNIDMNKAI